MLTMSAAASQLIWFLEQKLVLNNPFLGNEAALEGVELIKMEFLAGWGCCYGNNQIKITWGAEKNPKETYW